MLALGTGLDAAQTVTKGKVDGLIIAQLEVQARVMLDTAPVAPEERVAPDEVERPGNIAPVSLGQHQRDVVTQPLLSEVEEGTREIG